MSTAEPSLLASSQAQRATGASQVVRLLEQQGVRIVAGIPGGALLPIYEALGCSKIRHVLTRHEQAAGFIAQGMARMTGKAGVCLATSGPGVTNMVTALADAKLDSVPLVCIAGQVPTHMIGTDAFQEVATLDMVRPITKASFFVADPSELPATFAQAFAIAERGRPGPVLIDIPKDVQLASLPASCSSPEPPESSHFAQLRGDRSDDAAYAQAIRLIHAAERPVLYVGGGVVKARAHDELRRFAERHAIPVTTTLMALGALPAGHPLNIGMLGMHGARYTNLLLEECDLLIAIGARFDDRATGRTDCFAARARIVHIDIDRRELGKIKTPTVAICDDAAEALAKLFAMVQPTRRPGWSRRIVQLRRIHGLKTPDDGDVCSPYGIVRAVSELIPADSIITTDVGQHQMWVAQMFAFQRPDRWLTSGGLGTMGFGLPAAIGAALTDRSATAVCFTGDGSLLMNIQELATLAELDLNVKIVVLDNAALGLVRQQQELFYGRRLVASMYAQPANFVAIAHAFGVAACDLGLAAASRTALANALRRDGPVLIRVPIAAERHVLPMVAPGKANVEAIDYAME
jgi:acetolactate synthase-1/2/3 large subunit